ncbi:MAG TPA: cytochrome c-type biogenesis protein [Candidatus Competibacteraceae bacterium]|nr:cytochrome c-type biogenesis protein [Candidatus Competibacteraceae bacterium]
MRRWLPLLLALLAPPALAAIDAEHRFDDPAQEARYRDLIAELRCPKCQNQNIADSNAPLAQDLRQKVYDMMQAGRSDQEIVDYLVARYGDFVRYRPPLRADTWLLWFGPFAAIGAAALGVALWLHSRAQRTRPALDEHARQRLAELLRQHDEDSR